MQVMGGPEAGPGDVALAEAGRLAARWAGTRAEDVRLVRSLSTTWLAMSEGVVVKVHAPGASGEDLARRLALAGAPELRGCVLTPMVLEPVLLDPAPVWATVWPLVEPLPSDGDDADIPWGRAGELLARLHRLEVPAPAGALEGSGVLPPHGGVTRLRAALHRLASAVTAARRSGRALPPSLTAAIDVVRDAAAGLPAASWSASGPPGVPGTLVHGDWHLGQLGRLLGGAPDRLRLIDVDDLGVGDPAWDLGRPAAFRAAGLMPDDAWEPFLDAYRRAGGPAVPPAPADPWPALDAAAQASLVLAAAAAVRRAVERAAADGAPGVEPDGRHDLGDLDARLVEVCAGLPGTSGRPAP